MAQAPTPSLIPTALTSLDRLKAWVVGNASAPTGAANFTASDTQLIQLINSASRMAMSFMARPTFLMRRVDEIRSGIGNASILTREWPIYGDLISLSVGTIAIAKQSSVGLPGWVIENPWDQSSAGNPGKITLVGYTYSRGITNVRFSYYAGYYVDAESQVLPSTGIVWPFSPLGSYAANWKVTKAGVLMTPVAAGTTPTTGQYVPPANSGEPYTFAVADAGQTVLLTYSYIPAEIDYAVMKWAGESYKYRQRIGMRSQAIAQETTSYQLVDMPDDVKLTLQQYQRTVSV